MRLTYQNTEPEVSALGFFYAQISPRTAAHPTTSNPTLWNEPLRSQLVLASLDGLISYAAKVHFKARKTHERKNNSLTNRKG
ncbi:Uncharacterised protein [Klebsiella pneumoniae]|nr:Uncharacterised protein [Klebsiella pneumoniae]VTN93555.1 Uncharacterised protein [Klebsiella pneumoniae]